MTFWNGLLEWSFKVHSILNLSNCVNFVVFVLLLPDMEPFMQILFKMPFVYETFKKFDIIFPVTLRSFQGRFNAIKELL